MSNTYIVGEQTKENILKESKKLFYEKGYTKTTYSEISSTAKINRALIPYHFKTKHILGVAIYQEIIKEFYELIDNLLDTSQFDADFVSVLHSVTYYRLLSTNVQFLRFIAELQINEDTSLFTAEEEKNWLTALGNKFTSMNEHEIHILTQMHIGVKKEMINLLCNKTDNNADVISHMHISMLMRYVGYSTKKIDELFQAAIEVANLLNFEITTGFSIELKYN